MAAKRKAKPEPKRDLAPHVPAAARKALPGGYFAALREVHRQRVATQTGTAPAGGEG